MKSKKSMFRSIFALILSLAILSGMTVAVYAEAEPQTVDSGTCGENVSWTLYDNGLLKISGNGEMENYVESPFIEKTISAVEIEEGVTSVGNNFLNSGERYKIRLENLSLPNSIFKIGKSSFAYCSFVNKVYIPDSVCEISDNAFCYCSFYNGIELSKNLKKLSTGLFFASNLKEIFIPESVTYICEDAFGYCKNLISIKIPDNVISIATDSFEYCRNLKEVFIGKSLKYFYIHTFFNCYSLEKIIVDDENLFFSSDSEGVLYNKDKTALAFYPMSGPDVFSIPEGVKTIGGYAFYDCRIKEIYIPYDLEKIGERAFFSCNNLKSITLSESISTVGMQAFSDCSIKKAVFKGTKENWDKMFASLPAFIDTDILFIDYLCGEELSADFSLNSSTLTIYGSGRMEDYSSAEDLPWHGIKDSIKTVVFDGEPTSIGDYAFSGLSALESIEIPESVTSIGANAFENCTSLKEITVPSAVDKINENTFKNCTALKTVNLPDGITSIGENAFYNTAVYNDPASYKGNNVLYLGDNRYLIAYGSQLDGQSFNDIVNPNAVLIADGAFRGADCETVQLNEGLKYIGKEAFADSSLKTVYFPEGVETCSKDIFKGCGSLTVNYSSSISDWYGMDIFLPENSVVYFTAKTEDGKVSVIYCNDDLPQEIGDISIDKNSPELEVKTKAFDGSETQKQFETISEHGFTMDYYDDIEVMDIKLKNAKGEVQPKAGKSVRVKIKAPESVREKILEFLDFRGDFNGLEINSNGVFLNGNKNKFTAEQQKAVMQKIILWHAFNEGNYQGRIYESFTFNNNLRLENGYLIFYVEHFSEFSVFTSPFEFAEKEITLDIGTKKKLDFILLDDKKTIRFESSKTSVATVDGDGVVTAKGSGETVITAYSDGVEVGSCTVTVNSPTLIFSENLSGTKVDYLTTVNFSCQVENPVEGATVHWYIDGNEYAEGKTCTVKEVKESFMISVKVVAKDGTVLQEKKEQIIKVKNGFFDKLLGFFRKLFGTLKTVNIS